MPYSLDLYDPVYGTVSRHNPAVPSTTNAILSKQRGIYVQDHIKLGDALAVTLGGRWDKAISGTNSNGTPAPEVSDNTFSPRAGATLTLTDWASLCQLCQILQSSGHLQVGRRHAIAARTRGQL